MNELKIFSNEEFGRIRAVEQNGEPWFVGKDVADILEYQNGSRDIKRHVDEEDRRKIMVFDGNQDKATIIINESGLYSLILSSKLPTAKRFKRWVTSEVLPSIRQHGAYLSDERIEDILSNPDTIIELATQLKQERHKRKVLQAENSELSVDNQIMKPKADYFADLVDRNLLTNFRDTAKQLGLKERKFINFLLDHKYIYRDRSGKLKPYANKNDGLFELKEFTNEKSGYTSTQTMITPKGREAFRLLCLPALM